MLGPQMGEHWTVVERRTVPQREDPPPGLDLSMALLLWDRLACQQ